MSLPECVDLLKLQPDFAAQVGRTWLHEVCAKAGVTCLFGVRFHPELSAIEYFWGECKRYTRRMCDYTLASLRKTVPDALALVGGLSGDAATKQARIGTIRRHFAHVIRYLDAYEINTLTPAQVEWCMHRYTSHRRTRDCDVEALEREWLSPTTRATMPANIIADKFDSDD